MMHSEVNSKHTGISMSTVFNSYDNYFFISELVDLVNIKERSA